MRSLTLFAFLILISSFAYAQRENKSIRNGNLLYRIDKFDEAEIHYRKAIDKNPRSIPANFNLGNSLYKQSKFSDAERVYQKLIPFVSDKYTRGILLYNYGNSLLKQKKYNESVNAYKSALLMLPGNRDIQYNLSFALKQQNQNNNKPKSNNPPPPQKSKSNSSSRPASNTPSSSSQGNTVSREEAERLLEALDNKEENQRKNSGQVKSPDKKIEKNW